MHVSDVLVVAEEDKEAEVEEHRETIRSNSKPQALWTHAQNEFTAYGRLFACFGVVLIAVWRLATLTHIFYYKHSYTLLLVVFLMCAMLCAMPKVEEIFYDAISFDYHTPLMGHNYDIVSINMRNNVPCFWCAWRRQMENMV